MSKDSTKELVLKINEAISSPTGIKFAHEMLVDIFGALIPGVLFLFGLLCSIGIPLCLLFSVDGFILMNDDSGWTLLIGFLLFLILSYTIGHIFYRKDIKIPDKLDVRREQRKKLKTLSESIEPYAGGELDDHIIRLVLSEIKPLQQGLKYVKFQSTTENHTSIEGSIIERRNRYNDRLIDACDECDDLLSSWLTTPVTEDWDSFDEFELPTCLIKVLFPELNEDKYTRKASTNIDIYTLDVSAVELYTAFINNTRRLLKQIMVQEGSPRSYKLAVCYLILHLQNESACATEARCDFPYLNYYKYLLKRQILDLLKYVDWQQTEIRTKNKINQYKIEIQINNPSVYSILAKNESHIRMASSSWYVSKLIRNISICVLIILLFVTGVWFYNTYSTVRSCSILNWVIDLFANNQSKPTFVNVVLAFMAPASMCIGFWYIKAQIVKFIHYQRLREIYYTLKVYHECVSNPVVDKA